jgi:hypothetical protein
MAQRNSAVTALLKRPVAFHPVLARMTGSVAAGLMLSQSVYWTGVVEEKQPDRGGWFYKTQAEWTDETCLSRWEQESARKLLRKWDFWHEDRRGQPARLWFRVSMDNLATAISQYEERPHSRMRENLNLDCEESTDSLRKNPSLFTETTADTTSENLGRFAASSSYSSMSRKTPQQIRYTNISRLADRAVELLKADPKILHGDLAEILKTWAAELRIPYFDAWPGVASPIQQAITIAIERCACGCNSNPLLW